MLVSRKKVAAAALACQQSPLTHAATKPHRHKALLISPVSPDRG
jgi:hypothetical protein